ncbi:unnamed protein product [Fusarium langsethiae]|nr:unnamed protein product [Fusarium langsethiae]
MSLLEGFNHRILDSHPGQLYLRTHLNNIHRMFYAPEDPAKAVEDKFRDVGLVSDAVITYRPFIRQILQFSHSIKNHASSPNFPSVSSEFRQDVTTPAIHPKARTVGDIDPQVVGLAKKGIKALIESTCASAVHNSSSTLTRAFHGLGDKRPIITNIFGTAHT